VYPSDRGDTDCATDRASYLLRRGRQTAVLLPTEK
jgi:hypothetical protein